MEQLSTNPSSFKNDEFSKFLLLKNRQAFALSKKRKEVKYCRKRNKNGYYILGC
jgi:5-methylcytosine-specific restriction endonuclease McrBC GTP-binding regulatory subunit McrB